MSCVLVSRTMQRKRGLFVISATTGVAKSVNVGNADEITTTYSQTPDRLICLLILSSISPLHYSHSMILWQSVKKCVAVSNWHWFLQPSVTDFVIVSMRPLKYVHRALLSVTCRFMFCSAAVWRVRLISSILYSCEEHVFKSSHEQFLFPFL